MPIAERLKLSKTLQERGIKPTVHFEASGKDNPAWKGDDASYSAKHYWVERQLGKPEVCEECGITTAKKYEWANISGLYHRDITDYKRLCTSCHRLFDDHAKKAWDTRRQIQ